MADDHTIDLIIETLGGTLGGDRKAALLIGAGCSVTAGIPLADGFVAAIKEHYPKKYSKAKEKTYARCMATLFPDERQKIIAKYVDQAKINWAHIGIACLVAKGIVDRIYTTNFDPLVIQACALLGIYPAVYDFTAQQKFVTGGIHDKAIFYLHGQRSGFVRRNTDKEVEDMSRILAPVLRDARESRTLIVIGYSGDNDPVFDQLVDTPEFDHGLYWIGYQDSEPSKHLQDHLLTEGKEAHYVRGWDADSFFIKLAQELDCFPPPFIDTPFTHLNGIMEKIVAFPDEPGIEGSDVLKARKKWITAAISEFEKGEEKEPQTEADLTETKTISDIQKLRMQGKHDAVLELWEKTGQAARRRIADEVAWAPLMQGNELADKAPSAGTPQETDKLFDQAAMKYAAALEIKPNMHEALHNWGHALAKHAIMKTGEDADILFRESYEKYDAALEIKPDKYEALNNWGIALSDQAKMKTGKEADILFRESYEKYDAALEIKPDLHEALYNWGIALGDHAKMTTGEEADTLFRESYEKYDAALEIKPDKHKALNNWGTTLSDQAKMKTGEEADTLYRELYEKYDAALEIKPDKHEALNNWANALLDQALTKTGAEADNLFQESCEKYEATLEIKPDKHEAMINWGTTLQYQAQTKKGKQAEKLFAKAKDKFLEVEESSPGSGAYSLACLESLTGNDKECRRWLEVSRDYGKLPTLEHINSDSDFDSVRNKKWFKDFLKTHPETK